MTVGKTELPNRICFLAHRTNFGRQGRLNERHIAYYQRRAKGGCGLITVGELSVSPNDMPYESTIAAHRPEAVDDFKKLTQAVHRYDSRVFAQLSHHGFQSSGNISRHTIWAPSATADFAFGETGKAMEPEDIADLVQSFGRAAEMVRQGDFDGIQLDLGPQSLLRQFLSPLSNQRQDEYGGSPENRMRLPLMVLDGVRRAVGADFTVGLTLCADEKFWGGINPEESVQFAQMFEQTGQVDFIQVTMATYYNMYLLMASMHTPAGFTLELSQQIKSQISIPVIAGYQIDFPQMAEDAVETGKADAVGFVRPLIADPDLANKHKAGLTDQICFCARDNLGCVNRINQSKPIVCVQNPAAGRESELVPKEQKTPKPKQVVVIGAGPAGMAAAMAATQKGHQVAIYESGDKPGGQVNLSCLGAGRGGMSQLTRYLQKALERLKVPIHLNSVMNAERVLALKPDAVVVATGCLPVSHPFPGQYGPPTVLSVWDVLKSSHPVGDKVLMIDEIGDHRSLACAELLADQGNDVTIVTSDPYIGAGLVTLGDLNLTLSRLLTKGVTLVPDVTVEKIDNDTVFATELFSRKPIIFDGYDTIVVAVDFSPLDRLYFELKGNLGQLFRAGDCVAPRGIEMAIYEGEKIGSRL